MTKKGTHQIIYLDHAATTPLDPEVFAAMEPWFTEHYGNPSSSYTLGYDARKTVDIARSTIAEVLNCSPQEIIFTAGGTESDNIAVFGVARQAQKKSDNAVHIITTAIEHSAVLHAFQALENEEFESTIVPVQQNGIVSVDALRNSVIDHTALVSVMRANNEIGTIQPVKEFVSVVKEKNKGVIFHTDACQASGALSLDTQELGVDLMSINASKVYGPKGVGALYVKRGTKLQPILYGGDQEQSLRPGTENVAGIVGFAKALEIAESIRKSEVDRQTKLRNKFIDGILKQIPDTVLNGDQEQRLPNNVNVFIKGIDGESLLFALDQYGVQASLGSACASGSLEPSHVLLALGYSKEDARRCLRLSLGRGTTEKEIDTVLALLLPLVEQLRNL